MGILFFGSYDDGHVRGLGFSNRFFSSFQAMERYPEAEPLTRQAVEGFRPSGEIFGREDSAGVRRCLGFPLVFFWGTKCWYFLLFFFLSPIWEHIFRRLRFVDQTDFFMSKSFHEHGEIKEEYWRVLSHVRSAGI